MKYENVPTINGVKRSFLLEISLSLPLFLAQYRMIAIGKIEVKIIDINSKRGNCHKSFKDNVKQIIKNNGIQISGGFVKVEIVLANLNFEFIMYNISVYIFKYIESFKKFLFGKANQYISHYFY